jgi:hypothetical protein
MLLAPSKQANTSKEFKIVPPGSHLVRFFKYVDCGTHIDEGTKIRENKIKYVPVSVGVNFEKILTTYLVEKQSFG